MIMGHEIVATVVSSGDTEASHLADCLVSVNPFLSCGTCAYCKSDAHNLCERRRVIGVDPDLQGGYAEYLVAPVRSLVAVMSSGPAELGALVEPFAVRYRGALLGSLVPGDAAVVIGGGTIGIAAFLAATRLGAQPVVLSEPTPHRRAIAERLGAVAVDPLSQDLAAALRSSTGGRGAAVALDCVGTSASVAAALSACRPQGTVVLVGMERPTMEIPLYDLVTQERRIVGSFGYTDENFVDTAEWISTMPPELEDFIEARATFSDIVERFRALADGDDPSIKVILAPSG
jgi:threonine dehydrogenase-like Zn-dependent dehydrogenase